MNLETEKQLIKMHYLTLEYGKLSHWELVDLCARLRCECNGLKNVQSEFQSKIDNQKNRIKDLEEKFESVKLSSEFQDIKQLEKTIKELQYELSKLQEVQEVNLSMRERLKTQDNQIMRLRFHLNKLQNSNSNINF
jgi:predicted  nucleic acid-binding Zn-ribbon protein